MEQMTKQTETLNYKQQSHTAQRIISVVFAIIEIILAFRLIFKFLGANPLNGFVHGINVVSQPLIGVFEGIFPRIASGLDNTAVFEPATFIAMVVIALIAWGVLKLTASRSGTRVKRTEYTEHDNQK